jgi:hypothetical protein
VEVIDRLRARSADTRASYTTVVVLIVGAHSVRRCGSMTRPSLPSLRPSRRHRFVVTYAVVVDEGGVAVNVV